MATRDINLVEEKKTVSVEVSQSRARLRSRVFAVGGIFTIILVVIIGYSTYLGNQVRNLDNSIKSETIRIQSLARNEAAYLLLKQKAQFLTTILSGRYPYISVFELFKNLEGETSGIKNMTLERNGLVSLSIRVPDLPTLDSFVNTLIAQAQKQFSRVELQGVSLNTDGSYQLTFSINSSSQTP